MTDKDPKDMTASEMLRKAADQDAACHSTGIDELAYLMGINDGTCYSVRFEALADKVDAELAQARELSLRRGAELWAKANGWPDFRDGEDFGTWLDRCAFQKPMDDCGEPVRFGEHYGDMKQWLNSIAFYDQHAVLRGSAGEEMQVERGERVKRPAPEALGADGLPIVAGDTVWLADEYSQYADSSDSANENEYSLLGVDSQETLLVEDNRLVVSGKNYVRLSTCNAWCPASFLTHTPPDTQERIDDDATMPPAEYCAVRGIDLGDDPDREAATTTMVRDLLRRQRELDARKGGE